MQEYHSPEAACLVWTLIRAAARSRQDALKSAALIQKIEMPYLRARAVLRVPQEVRDTPCAAFGSGRSSPSRRLLASA